MKLVELQAQRVGNLDTTQLNIAIQDCFNQLPSAPPLSLSYGLSIAQLTMLFTIPLNVSSPGIPYPSENLTFSVNGTIPTSVQAYLDNFPFGNFTPPGLKLLVPALILSAGSNFIYATAALYAVLSVPLLYLFRRPSAKPFTIQNVLSITGEDVTSPALHIIRGQAAAARVEHIATLKSDIDDSATEARINQTIGDHFTTLRKDLATRYPILEINCQQEAVAPTLLLQRYETMQTRTSRIAWVFTPVLGAALVGFGIAIWRHPHVVSHTPQDEKASLVSSRLYLLGAWVCGEACRYWQLVALFGKRTQMLVVW
jgi:hypothetical protein